MGQCVASVKRVRSSVERKRSVESAGVQFVVDDIKAAKKHWTAAKRRANDMTFRALLAFLQLHPKYQALFNVKMVQATKKDTLEQKAMLCHGTKITDFLTHLPDLIEFEPVRSFCFVSFSFLPVSVSRLISFLLISSAFFFSNMF